jgi:pimeloyl-ACP methyl ester carboxylesterase
MQGTASIESHPYFFTPFSCDPTNPLFVFLPGMDETGADLMRIQVKGLEAIFDVRCFVIPSEHLTDWNDLVNHVIALIEVELAINSRPVYLCGESFGSCLALKILQRSPNLSQCSILINSASSFHRVWLYNLGSVLLPWTPDFVYDISSIFTLPCLAELTRLSLDGIQALWNATQSAPKATAEQRLYLLRNFEVDETKLRQVTQPVLLIGSERDRLLPSVAEAHRLANCFPNHKLLTLPHSGHACLAEAETNLLLILQQMQFLPSELSPLDHPFIDHTGAET